VIRQSVEFRQGAYCRKSTPTTACRPCRPRRFSRFHGNRLTFRSYNMDFTILDPVSRVRFAWATRTDGHGGFRTLYRADGPAPGGGGHASDRGPAHGGVAAEPGADVVGRPGGPARRQQGKREFERASTRGARDR